MHERVDHSSTRRWIRVLAGSDLCVALLAAWLGTHGHRLGASLVAWSAVSLAAVTVLYARSLDGTNLGPVLKGARHPWLQPLFFPYRAVAWGITLLARLVLRRRPWLSEIAPRLYLGARPFVPDQRVLRTLGVDCVVDLCAELPTHPARFRRGIERLEIPVLDRIAPAMDEIDQAAAWAAERHAQGRTVFVHCAFGRGRSAVVAAATLVHLGRAHTVEEALALLVAQRRAVNVRGQQLDALTKYVDGRTRGTS